MSVLKIPDAPKSIQKGFPLKMILDLVAVKQLGENLNAIDSNFDKDAFANLALKHIEPLGIKERSEKISDAMKTFLPEVYSEALEIIIQSLTAPLEKTSDNGLAGLFYMPHCSFIAKYGRNASNNNNIDPFDVSIQAQYKLTKRFTCEFSIRPFLEHEQDRTFEVLYNWMNDSNPHVRRLCSEGTRPRLPWSSKLNALVIDPSPSLIILERLKNDPDLYVRRSVANHVGDIAKDHLDLALDLCESWLDVASNELKWVIRHAVRNPVKKGNKRAIDIRMRAK